MSVRWVRVGDLARQRIEPVRVEADATYSMLGLLNRGRGFFARGDVSGSETRYPALFKVHAGDLVYSKLFGWEGSVAIAGDAQSGGYVSSEFPIFVLDDQEVDRRYMAHVIASGPFVAQMAASTTGMGQRRQRVNPDRFRMVRFPLPDIDEQRRIAARLDAVAASVDKLAGDAEASLAGLYARLLHQGTASLGTLGEVLAIDDAEVRVTPDATYRRVGVRNRGRGVFRQPDMHGSTTAYPRLRVVRAGHVVLSRLKAFEGALGVAGTDHDGCVVSPEFHTYRVLRPEDQGYVAAVTRSPAVWEQLRAASTGVGARRERVDAEALLNVRVPVCSSEVRASISRQARHLGHLDALLDRRQRLAAALLPAARNEEFARLINS